MAKQFSRQVDDGLIANLKKTNLWTKKLEADCIKGNVFLAIRDDCISFYHKGGGFYNFRKKGFSTNVQYAVTIDKEGYIYENCLGNAVISNFFDGYDRIKKNCEQYSKKSEAEGVSWVYHKYPYNSAKSNVVVLDVEITASGEKDRIDILLFNKQQQTLRFIEAKLFSNDDIRSKTRPKVIDQLDGYKDMIKKRHDEFLSAYQKYIDTLNSIFGLKLPKPKKIDDNLGLLIFGFDEDQRAGRLQRDIKKLKSYGALCYPIGEIKGINAETLWNNT